MEQIEQFKQWLETNGAIILPPTNPWEVLRFNSNEGTGIVYKNKRGKLTFTGAAQELFSMYLRKVPGALSPNRTHRQRNAYTLGRLFARDGRECFYCGCGLGSEFTDPGTVEHLLSISHGGSDHLSNLVPSCSPCNAEAGNLPIIEKVKLRESKRK